MPLKCFTVVIGRVSRWIIYTCTKNNNDLNQYKYQDKIGAIYSINPKFPFLPTENLATTEISEIVSKIPLFNIESMIGGTSSFFFL